MYAIIETCGKQYRVTPGDVVFLDRLDGNVGQTVTFDKVLLIGGKGEGAVLVGTPYLSNAALQGEIVEQSRGEKLLTIKYKRRKGYRKMIGHRQALTKVLVTRLEDGQGQNVSFDAAKRVEFLKKANVATAKQAEKKPAKAAAPKAESVAKTAAPAKTAAKKNTTTKTASASKSTAAKKKA